MTADQQLERSVLEGKEREELHAIAQALSVKTNTRTKKADMIDGILKATGVAVDGPSDGGTNGGDPAASSNGGGPAPAAAGRRRSSGGRSSSVATDDGDSGSGDEPAQAGGRTRSRPAVVHSFGPADDIDADG